MKFTNKENIGIALAFIGICGINLLLFYKIVNGGGYGTKTLGIISGGIILLILGLVIFFMRDKQASKEEKELL